MFDVYKIQGAMAMHIGRVRKNYNVGDHFRLKSCLRPLHVVKKDNRGIYCAYKNEMEALKEE